MLTHERFAYLAEKYIDTVFRVAFSYLKSREDADDVTQEVFMKLYSVNTVFESESCKQKSIEKTKKVPQSLRDRKRA